MAPQAYTAGELDESKFTVSLARFMDRYGSDNDEVATSEPTANTIVPSTVPILVDSCQ